MANTTLTPDIIAKEATLILENELCMAKLVHRGYEDEFSSSPNGYKVGDTVTIRKPTDFTVGTTSDITSSIQDVVEGSTSITVNKIRNVAFQFTAQELALDIKQVSDRQIRPAMVQLANAVDTELMALYKSVPNWVGTPGQTVNSYADFAKAPERLDEYAVPMGDRSAVMSPADHWGLLGSQTALYMQDVAKGAYRKGSLGEIGGIDTFMSQNAPTHTVGIATGTPLVKGANQNVTYAASKDTGTQSLITDGWTASQTGILKAGDVFTIANVYAVNPVSKATLPFLKQFTVTADADSDGSTNATLTISPPIITSGANQTCSAVPVDNAAITVVGTGSTAYRQNLVFHKNAFALAMVPLPIMPGSVDASRQSYKGVSVRITPVYNGLTDVSVFRADILFGVKAIDPRLALRLSGTA
jgi:hypothetical protein